MSTVVGGETLATLLKVVPAHYIRQKCASRVSRTLGEMLSLGSFRCFWRFDEIYLIEASYVKVRHSVEKWDKWTG
jgi:hypothetical protein